MRDTDSDDGDRPRAVSAGTDADDPDGRSAARAAESTGRERVDRLLDHLGTDGTAPDEQRLERRITASAALAGIARDRPESLANHLPVLVAHLRPTTGNAEDTSGGPGDPPRVRDNLLRCVASVLVERPAAIPAEDIESFAGAVTTDLTDGTLRRTAKALFVGAGDRPEDLSPAVDALADLVTYPDGTVQAWSAGALGRLATDAPDAVAGAADGLRDCLGHDDDAVQHNAVEALGALVRERPEAVVPACGGLRDLLDHDEDAIQHNAAGILGHLAADRPEAVVPAVEDLQGLRDHDDEAIRRVATAALARLAGWEPDAADPSGE